MDRFLRPVLTCGLGLFLVASGCRSTKPEVPPGRPFAKDGQQRQAIQFSSEGHPTSAQGSAPYMPNNLGGSDIASGISTGGSRPDGAAYGGPPAAYGPPGSAGAANLNDPAMVKAATTPASIPLTGTPPAGTPPINLPPMDATNLPDLNVTPARDTMPLPNPIIPSPMEKPGEMGTPNQMPSPN